MLISTIIAESQKAKNTFTSWFTVLGSLLLPLLFFLIYLFRSSYFIPDKGVNAWTQFFNHNFGALGSLLFTFFVILVVGLNLNMEHKANSWKKLFVLPVRKDILFTGKLLFMMVQIFASLLLFAISMLFFGIILGLIHPELGFLSSHPDITYLFELVLRMFISVLAVLSIQYFLSIFFDNIIIPISIGMFLTIASIILANGWSYVIYDPYAYSYIFVKNMNAEVNIPSWHGITTPEIMSVVYFIIINIVSLCYFKRKMIK